MLAKTTMIRNVIQFCVLFLFAIGLSGQSLGKERVDKLKETVVKIITNGQTVGTGFFISSKGLVASCWHVIEGAVTINGNQFAQPTGINIELPNGSLVPYKVHPSLQNKAIDAKVNDYVILTPVTPLPIQFNYLNLGSFADISEGDEIYTCGYPLKSPVRFISKGILSTKFNLVKNENNITHSTNVAFLDLTINKGNSGGPIIKVGKTPLEDKVIGIASFMITPFREELDNIQKFFQAIGNSGVVINGISQNKISSQIIDAVNANSVGISGCHSIDYLKSKL